MRVDEQTLKSLSLAHVVLLAIPAYILGAVFTPTARIWHRLFSRNPDIAGAVLKRFRATHPSVTVNFEAQEAFLLLAFIQRRNKEVATNIERLNAIHIMLRNISFAFLLLTVAQLVEFLRIGWSVWGVFPPLVLFLLSLFAGKAGVRFAELFFLAIYEAITADRLQVEELVGYKPRDRSAS